MIFLTVGTVLPFDRLVGAIDAMKGGGVIDDVVIGQTGSGQYRPRYIETVDMMSKADYENYMNQAEMIIGHAGMGTITSALEREKPLLVMPRISRLKEVVNNHQQLIAREFEQRGHLLVAWQVEQLLSKLKVLKQFKPSEREPDIQGVISRLKDFFDGLIQSKVAK